MPKLTQFTTSILIRQVIRIEGYVSMTDGGGSWAGRSQSQYALIIADLTHRTLPAEVIVMNADGLSNRGLSRG